MSNPDTEEDGEVEHEIVRVIGCDIYFYGDVDRANAFDFIDAFKKLEIELLQKSIELEGYTPTIRVHIHSDGGDVFSGLSMMDTLRSSRVKVVTIAEGTCCSAATLILLGGCKRLMGRHAFILIHQLSTGFFGKYKDLKDEMKTCKKVMATLKTLYDDSTTIPKDKLSEFMKRDIYLGYEECLKYEIVHGHS